MDNTEAVSATKNALREAFVDRRDNLDADAARRASSRVCRRLDEVGEIGSTERIAGYMSRGNEIDLRPWLSDVAGRGVDVLLPRVTGPGQMEFCVVDDFDDLEPGAFGIEEPVGEASSIDDVEVFLVPGLAFDRQGTRLGFGMGFYDRALPSVGDAVAVGIGHHWQLVDDELPRQSHDRPMDLIVTDRDIHNVAPGDSDEERGA